MNGFKISFFVFCLCFLPVVMGATTVEELKSTELTQSTEGPLDIEIIQKVYDVLGEVGHEHVINDALIKLGFNKIDDLNLIVQVCSISNPNKLGTYLRGKRLTYKMSLEYSIDILAQNWGDDILTKIEESYRHHYIESEVFNSLVIQEWPTICLRPGLSLLKLTTTLVHELIHYTNDDYKYEEDLSSQQNFIKDSLYSPGGEFDAFYQEVDLKLKILKVFGIPDFMAFSVSGEDGSIDEDKLANFILKSLGYEEKFINNYKYYLLSKHTALINRNEYIGDLLRVYEKNSEVNRTNLDIELDNREIYISNIDVFENNIPIYEKNIKIYKNKLRSLDDGLNNSGDYNEVADKLFVEEEKLIKAKEGLLRAIKKLEISPEREANFNAQIKFNQNLIDLSGEELISQGLELDKMKKTLELQNAKGTRHVH